MTSNNIKNILGKCPYNGQDCIKDPCSGYSHVEIQGPGRLPGTITSMKMDGCYMQLVPFILGYMASVKVSPPLNPQNLPRNGH